MLIYFATYLCLHFDIHYDVFFCVFSPSFTASVHDDTTLLHLIRLMTAMERWFWTQVQESPGVTFRSRHGIYGYFGRAWHRAAFKVWSCVATGINMSRNGCPAPFLCPSATGGVQSWIIRVETGNFSVIQNDSGGANTQCWPPIFPAKQPLLPNFSFLDEELCLLSLLSFFNWHFNCHPILHTDRSALS